MKWWLPNTMRTATGWKKSKAISSSAPGIDFPEVDRPLDALDIGGDEVFYDRTDGVGVGVEMEITLAKKKAKKLMLAKGIS
jgi:hypothetical protein